MPQTQGKADPLSRRFLGFGETHTDGFPEHLRQKLRATAICAEQRTLQRAKQCEVICVWEPRTCDPLPVSRKPKWGGSSRGE